VRSDKRVTAMEQALLACANAGGGWGYNPGHASRLEPTCWALLALLPNHPALGGNMSVHLDFLQGSQRRDGLFVEAAVSKEDRPNLAFNALAAILLEHHHMGASVSRDLVVSALIQHKGIKFEPSEINRQDNGLQGWGWIDGTFSWVEPTAWCLLALKKASTRSADARARIQEAERVLIDRCCAAGGWNYGNSNMLGQTLLPYMSTTATGLLAMQDRRQDPCVVRSIEYLVQHRVSEQSAMALGLTLIALRVLDHPHDDVRDRLLAQWDRTGFLGNVHLTALALYALGGQPNGGEAFHV
jgi:hypothetical protein